MVIGTAGHTGHGQCALVKALVGVSVHRLPEEQWRGMTVELAFAGLSSSDGQMLSFVDMPGHGKLVRTMVAGTSGIDCALLVVAVDEGVMPQTVEHLTILALLGVARGVVVIRVTRCTRSSRTCTTTPRSCRNWHNGRARSISVTA